MAKGVCTWVVPKVKVPFKGPYFCNGADYFGGL